MNNFFNKLKSCKACLDMVHSDDNTVPSCTVNDCMSSCRVCLDDGKPCPECAEQNQPSHITKLRACKQCLDAREQCIHCIVSILSTDCEEGNKKAMELIAKLQEDQCIAYLVFLANGVYVGKSLNAASAIGLLCQRKREVTQQLFRPLEMTKAPMPLNHCCNYCGKKMLKTKTEQQLIQFYHSLLKAL